MSNKTLTIIVVACIFIIITYKCVSLLNENNILKKEKEKLETSYFKLLEDYLSKTKSIPESVKQDLERLKEKYASIDKNIEAELITVIELLKDGYDAIAIEKLTKVIENALKNQLEIELKDNRKRTFYDSIKEAIKVNVICDRLGAFINSLRMIRNEEAHDLNVTLKENEALIYVLTGIHILYELSGTKRENQLVLSAI